MREEEPEPVVEEVEEILIDDDAPLDHADHSSDDDVLILDIKPSELGFLGPFSK